MVVITFVLISQGYVQPLHVVILFSWEHVHVLHVSVHNLKTFFDTSVLDLLILSVSIFVAFRKEL